MKLFYYSKPKLLLPETFLISLYLILLLSAVNASESAEIKPIADAGLPKYAATGQVQLDGSNSYDPDQSGQLTYKWTQVSGPSLVISDTNTAKPMVKGFNQTNYVQKCEFELVVSDGELSSRADLVSIIIVPSFGTNTMTLENPPFDPNEPTFLYFGGGNCVTGSGKINVTNKSHAPNIIDFPNGYEPDKTGTDRKYFHYGDMLITYLSSVAPDYKQPIQTSGWSTGGQPAIDVGLRLNLIYKDARYTVNQVTFLDAATSCRYYSEDIQNFLASSVDGERCFIDNYVSQMAAFYPNILNVGFSLSDHSGAPDFYVDSFNNPGGKKNQFNNGIVAGAYWSVFGPGKNLQLVSTPGIYNYWFYWEGTISAGSMYLSDELDYPARLPEPVTLIGPSDGNSVDANGAILSCQDSENAIQYQLLFGRDPFHMIYLAADTVSPPNDVVSVFPFEETWWTIKAYDMYGSYIYADPHFIKPENVVPQTIKNACIGQTYSSIQEAINDAQDGDEIILGAGRWPYMENLDFKGKTLTLRSDDPNDPNIVAMTILIGNGEKPVITLSPGGGAHSKFEGLTILGGTVGITCAGTSPTIRNCLVDNLNGIAIDYWKDFEPVIIDSNIIGEIRQLPDPRIIAYWRLDEQEGNIAKDSVAGKNGTLYGSPTWLSEGGKVSGAVQLDGNDNYIETPFIFNPSTHGPFSIFAWVKGGEPGKVILSQIGQRNFLSADSLSGYFMVELQSRSDKKLVSQTVITDGNWHHVGLVWDGFYRTLYVDDEIAAKDDTSLKGALPGSTNGFYIGAGKSKESDSFWNGLIDDVRIYNQAIQP